MQGHIVLLLLAAFTAQAQTRPAPKIPPDMATFMEGLGLNDDQVAANKKTLDTSPDDLNAHLKLLAYYSLRKNGEGDEHSEFAKYLLWMIDHRPESFIFELGIIQLNWEPSPHSGLNIKSIGSKRQPPILKIPRFYLTPPRRFTMTSPFSGCPTRESLLTLIPTARIAAIRWAPSSASSSCAYQSLLEVGRQGGSGSVYRIAQTWNEPYPTCVKK